MGAVTRWRDPGLGLWLREERQRIGVSARDVSASAWELGIPLSTTEVHRHEQGRRHPTPWHLHAWMEILALKQRERERLVLKWAQGPRWGGLVKSWPEWRQLLAEQPFPIPVSRQARPDRLHSPVKGVLVATSFKLRLTAREDALLRSFAQLHDVRISTIVRDAVVEALRVRRKASPRDQETARDTAHNVRLVLTKPQRAVFRGLSHGVDFNTWAWLIVMDDLESGRAASRYHRAEPTTVSAPAA